MTTKNLNIEIYRLSKLNNFIKNTDEVIFEDLESTTSCNDHSLIKIEIFSPCIDKISLFHNGCILSKASANALLLEIEKKEKTTAIKIVNSFIAMINNKTVTYDLSSNLTLFLEYLKYPSRIDCVLSSAFALQRVLND